MYMFIFVDFLNLSYIQVNEDLHWTYTDYGEII